MKSVYITLVMYVLVVGHLNAVGPPENIYFPNKESIQSSFPYITGDTVRFACDHILDPITSFDPLAVKCGDTIFVIYDYMEYFFANFHPYILEPYILVSHHFFDSSDDPVPGLNMFANYLDDDKLIGWFTHNIDRVHPKLHPHPIGIGNACYHYGNKAIFDQFAELLERAPVDKNSLLYMNFSTASNRPGRKAVYEFFQDKNFCTRCGEKLLQHYLSDVIRHKFVLSPPGHGLDCFRTWEALLMKSYPVVKTSTLDPLFEDLPVVIIHDWAEVTEEFLERKYQELSQKEYKWEKLYMPYWLNQIRLVKESYIASAERPDVNRSVD